MSDPIYIGTLLKDHAPYAVGEQIGLGANQAAAQFAAGVISLSDDDQATLSSQILAAQAANGPKPVAVTTIQNPDGSISVRLASGSVPPYGN